MKVLGRQGVTVLGLQNELYSDRPSANNYLGNGMPEYRSEPKKSLGIIGRYAFLLGLSIVSTGCPFCPEDKAGGGGGGGGTDPTKTYTVRVSLFDTSTRRQIGSFNYNVCSSDKQTTNGQVTETVNAGDCTWKFWGDELEIPREVVTNVSKDRREDILVIAKDSNFPVTHYMAIVPIAAPESITYRFTVDNFSVYAVKDDRGGDVQKATPVIHELYDRLNANYAGIVDSIPSDPAEGSIYVSTVPNLVGADGKPLAGTVEYHFLAPGWIKWVEVKVRPAVGQFGVNHEVARALGFRGNAPGIYDPVSPTMPTDDDKKSVELASNRSAMAYLDSKVDRDKR